MRAAGHFVAVIVLCSCRMPAQGTPTPAPEKTVNPWSYSLTIDGYIVPAMDGPSYASPVFTADNKIHLEARYNYENQRTASLWAGYDFTFGKTVQVALTPMIGGVFGRTTGIAPGLEASVTYKKIEFSLSNEYVFDTSNSAGSFYYSWPQLTYSPVGWFRVGGVAQHTKAFQTGLEVQRGFLVGFSHKKVEFTTYVFDPEQSPTVVLEVGFSF